MSGVENIFVENPETHFQVLESMEGYWIGNYNLLLLTIIHNPYFIIHYLGMIVWSPNPPLCEVWFLTNTQIKVLLLAKIFPVSELYHLLWCLETKKEGTPMFVISTFNACFICSDWQNIENISRSWKLWHKTWKCQDKSLNPKSERFKSLVV